MEILRQIQAALEENPSEELIEALREHLVRVWHADADLVAEILEGRVGDGGATDEVIELALGDIDPVMGRRFMQQVRQQVDEVRRLVYEMELAEWSAPGVRAPGSRPGLSGVLAGSRLEAIGAPAVSGDIVTERMLQWMDEYDAYWLRTNYDRNVRSRVREALAEARTEGLSRKDAGALLAGRMRGVLKDEATDNYFELVASAVTVRSKEFAKLEAFERMGVEEYEWDSVLDRRTSEICRHLDGMRFSVADAIAWRGKLLDVDQDQPDWPERIKELAPWPRPSDVAGKGAGALIEMGVAVPPAHGRCRSRISPVL